MTPKKWYFKIQLPVFPVFTIFFRSRVTKKYFRKNSKDFFFSVKILLQTYVNYGGFTGQNIFSSRICSKREFYFIAQAGILVYLGYKAKFAPIIRSRKACHPLGHFHFIAAPRLAIKWNSLMCHLLFDPELQAWKYIFKEATEKFVKMTFGEKRDDFKKP